MQLTALPSLHFTGFGNEAIKSFLNFVVKCAIDKIMSRHKKSKPHSDRPQGKPQKGARPTLYGFHAVSEAWLNKRRYIDALYVTDQGHKSFEGILQKAQSMGLQRPAPIKVDKQDIDRMLPQGAVHQGLALAVKDLEELGIQDLIIRGQGKDKSVLVMLDQVTDPHNVGAILRSACVFGLDGMIMQRKHAPTLDGVLAKTACGGVEHVPVAYETNLNRTLEELKESGYFVYGLDERGDDLRSISNLPDKIVLVLGAEGPGLRRLVKENCDSLLRLPTSGPISSLNVSNAAAVSFYALTST